MNKDSSYPKISIVTPSYNQVEFLEKTILSVLNQNYPNLEYIIIDGGSKDGSLKIIKKYQKYLTYWSSKQDRGQAEALKRGFQISSGELLAWLNSDDIYLPGTLNRIAQAYRENPNFDVYYGNMLIIDEKDKAVSERRLTYCLPYVSKIGFLYGGFGIYQPAVFWTRKIYQKVGGINKSYQFCMDSDLLVKFALNNARFKFIREYLTAFRVHEKSKSSTIMNVAKSEFEEIVKKNSPLFYKIKWRINKPLFKFLCLPLYLLQGDLDYIYFRLFKDKVKWLA